MLIDCWRYDQALKIKKYAFKEDASVTKAGTVFYRLKQFDEYGNANYSAVVKVK